MYLKAFQICTYIKEIIPTCFFFNFFFLVKKMFVVQIFCFFNQTLLSKTNTCLPFSIKWIQLCSKAMLCNSKLFPFSENATQATDDENVPMGFKNLPTIQEWCLPFINKFFTLYYSISWENQIKDMTANSCVRSGT